MAAIASRTGAPRLLTRDFALLWQGQLVSRIGGQVFLVAFLFRTREVSDSAALTSLLMICFSLPAVLLGPIAGAIVDRGSRKRVIVLGDASRGLVMLGLLPFFASPQVDPRISLAALVTAALSCGVAAAFFAPAVVASIPDLVGRERLAAANSLHQLSIQGSSFLGQAMGGVALAWLGAPLLLLLDGLLYLLSATSELFLRIPGSRRPSPSRTPGRSRWLSDARSGLRYVRGAPGMLVFLLAVSCVNCCLMPVVVLFPFYVTDVLGRGPEWYGFLLAAISAGSLPGLLLGGRLHRMGERRGWALCAALAGVAILTASFGLIRTGALALAVAFGAGLLTAGINVSVVTLLQLATPPAVRGRVIGIFQSLSGAAAPLGMALGGVLGDAAGLSLSWIYLASGASALLVVVAASASRPLRTFLSRGRDRDGSGVSGADPGTGAAGGPGPGA